MSKYCGPRLRIIRRLGNLLAFTRKTRKRNTQPGQHGVSRKKLTQFAFRLTEKQKLRFYYGISEAQLKRYVKEARKSKGSTGQILLQKIEIRLDTILYRLNWAPTVPYARQIINHGHIMVRQKRVTIPSFSCLPRHIIGVQKTRKSKRLIEKNFGIQNIRLPSYLRLDIKNMTAVVNHYVDRKRIPLELNELLVIEYYSNRL
jgi:small subunit ribosomal protein S4